MTQLEETRLANGMFRLASPDLLKPRNLTPPEKIALENKHTLLAEKATSRQIICWRHGCNRQATVWVREVSYDFKGDRAEPVQHATVSSADFDGPVPGFCHFCLGVGPSELAEAVYFNKPEIAWGVTPTRWFVVFTDDTRQGGSCMELNLKRAVPNPK